MCMINGYVYVYAYDSVYVYVYVYICVYVYVYVYMYMYMYMNMYMYMYMYIYIYAYVYEHSYVYVYAYVDVCVWQRVYVYVYVYYMFTVYACYGVTYIHEKYWCLKYCTRHATTFLWPYIAQHMHRKDLKKMYLHHTHAQPGTHGVGMLRCHVHTRKILMSEILQTTRNNLSMTIYTHRICTEKSSKKSICIMHMHNRALTVWACCGVTYIHEKYWCLKYCTRHSRTFLGPYIHTVYAQKRPDK
jgi:hypothetical protein